MSTTVKGFRAKKAPGKKEMQNALDGQLNQLRQNQGILLQMTQRSMMDNHAIKGQLENLESLIGYKSSDSAIVQDDVVVINCVGYFPETGLPFANSRLERAVIRVGSGQLVPGFESQLIGLQVSEKLNTIDVTFPEDYGSKDLAGKTVKFDIQIVDVLKKTVSTARFDQRVTELEAMLKAKQEQDNATSEKEQEQTQPQTPQ